MAVSTLELKREDRRLTHSEIQTAKTCLRKHQLQYGLGLRKQEQAQPLRFGSAFHEGLDVRAKAIQAGASREDAKAAAFAAALTVYDKDAPAPHADRYQEWLLGRTVLTTLLNAYDWRWAENDRSMEVIASEMTFNVPIVNPETNRSSRTFTFAGKIDKIVKLNDGRIAIMEHKTAGQDIAPGSDYQQRLRIDSQISGYYIAGNHLGYQVDTVLYDVIRKPTIKPSELTQAQTKELIENGVYKVKDADGEWVEAGHAGSVTVTPNEADPINPSSVVIDGEQAEVIPGKKGFAIRETPRLFSLRLTHDLASRPDYYFQRREIPRVAADLEEAQYELREEAVRIHTHAKRGIFPRNTGACIGFGRCPYFDLCTTGFDPSSETVPDGFYVTDAIHVELED